MSKLKDQKWVDKPRLEKLAGAVYPHLLPPDVQREMLAANEEQRAGLQKRIDAFGGAKPQPPKDYSRVPGLIPKK
jgi:hypothetical protein